MYHLADQHPIELRAGAELLRRAVNDPLGRADLAEPPDGVTHALERVGAEHVRLLG
jgi:hypothetical protein